MAKPGYNKFFPVIRIALVVTYLSLFATQLSYKFYYLASFPCYSAGGIPASDHQKIGSMRPGAKGIFVLSLDKRYDGKQLYARPAVIISINHPLPAATVYSECIPENILRIIPVIATQRGPPFPRHRIHFPSI